MTISSASSSVLSELGVEIAMLPETSGSATSSTWRWLTSLATVSS
jgi:hypothetical protein